MKCSDVDTVVAISQMIAIPGGSVEESASYAPLLRGLATLFGSSLVRLHRCRIRQPASAITLFGYLGEVTQSIEALTDRLRELHLRTEGLLVGSTTTFEPSAALDAAGTKVHLLTFGVKPTESEVILIDVYSSSSPQCSVVRRSTKIATALLPTVLSNVHLCTALGSLADKDELTGSYNLRYLQRALNDLDSSRCSAYSLVMIDVDSLKKHNDRFGHLSGSRLICEVAEVIRKHISSIDYLVRFGGDEFVLVLPGTNKACAVALGERVRSAVERFARDSSHQRHAYTCSLGVAQYPCDGQNATAVLRSADAALLLAKKQGRNRVMSAKGLASQGDSLQRLTFCPVADQYNLV